MSTILEVTQGGTGVQSVAEFKDVLGLKGAAECEVSQNPNDISTDKLVSSYTLNEKAKSIVSELNDKVVSIEKGGTGAQNKEDAFKNIVGAEQLPISKGGTGAFSKEGALDNLIGDALPISKGGTGATTATEAIKNLGIGQTTIQYPISIENGGTGATTAAEAIQNLGISQTTIQYPISIENGGTGATDSEQARLNLGIELPLSVANGGTGVNSILKLKEVLDIKFLSPLILGSDDDLNDRVRSGIYISPEIEIGTTLVSESPIMTMSLDEGDEGKPVDSDTQESEDNKTEEENKDNDSSDSSSSNGSNGDNITNENDDDNNSSTDENETTPPDNNTEDGEEKNEGGDGSEEDENSVTPSNPSENEGDETGGNENNNDNTGNNNGDGTGDGNEDNNTTDPEPGDGNEEGGETPPTPPVTNPDDIEGEPSESKDLHYPAEDITRFVMLVISNMTEASATSGVASQLLMTIEDSESTQLGRLFYRSYKRVVSDAIDKNCWSDWIEMGVGEVPPPVVNTSSVKTLEWNITTTTDEKNYSMPSDGSSLVDPSKGVYLVFLGSQKLGKSQYTINVPNNSISLDNSLTVEDDQILSITFIGN